VSEGDEEREEKAVMKEVKDMKRMKSGA